MAVLSPSMTTLRSRNSAGSMPMRRASSSTCDSMAKQAWGSPGERMWPHGTVFV
jgi:hypothetical protein